MLIQQFQEFEHHACATQRGQVGPGREGGLRRGNGGIHVGHIAQFHLGCDRAGGGVGDGLLAGALASDHLALDVVRDGVAHEKFQMKKISDRR